jgi:hypothetical protein
VPSPSESGPLSDPFPHVPEELLQLSMLFSSSSVTNAAGLFCTNDFVTAAGLDASSMVTCRESNVLDSKAGTPFCLANWTSSSFGYRLNSPNWQRQ